jgi:large subunit ribosomal protein L34e
MPTGKYRSRTLRRIHKRTPGGRTVLRYKKRAPGKAVCAVCGAELHGIPRTKPSKIRHTPKTKKRPERPYGGYLCSRCMRVKVKSQIQ